MKFLICTQKVDQNDSNLSFFVRWIEEFAKNCEQVTVICLQKGASSLPNNALVFSLGKKGENAGLRTPYSVLHTSFSRTCYIFRLLHLAWRERKNYDMVLVHMNPEYLLVCGWLWKLLGKRVGLWYTHRSERLLKITLPFIDHVFTAVADSFPIQTDKLHVMGHGIDGEFFVPATTTVARHPISALVVGRISSSKYLMETLKACEFLGKNGWRLRFVGKPLTKEDEDYARQLREYVKKETLEENVSFSAVAYGQLPEVYKEANIFLNQDNAGSMNKVVLEALLCGVPVVTANLGYKELFDKWWESFSFSDRDPEALARRIRLVQEMDDDTMAHAIEEIRQKILTHHSLQKLIPRILASYKL